MFCRLPPSPGVFMGAAGVKDEAMRIDLIACLRTLSDQPLALLGD
jgi:cytochrome c2